MRTALVSLMILLSYGAGALANDLPESSAGDDLRGSDAKELFSEAKPFFDSDSARTSFSPDVVYQDAPEMGSFRDDIKRVSLKEKLQREAADEEKKAAAIEAAKLGQTQPSLNAEEKEKFTSAKDVVAEFGDPTMNQEVLGQKDAPKPYRAMLAALHVGDDALAYKYAKQYARYLRDVQSRAKRTSGLTGLAMTSEEMLPDNNWAVQGANEIDKELLRADQLSKKSADPREELSISDKARELIKSATEESSAPAAAPKRNTVAEAELKGFQSDESVQAQYARAVGGSVLRDPQGKVDIYFFFRPQDQGAFSMAQDIEKVFSAVQGDKNIRFAALTIEETTEVEKQTFKRFAQVTFPVIDGSSIAREMKVNSSPTVVIAAGTTGEAMYERGRRGAAYLMEKIRLVKGGR